MKKLALAFLLFACCPLAAQAADSAWVQAVANGYEARLVTGAAACPVLHTDKGDVAMTVRAAATRRFPAGLRRAASRRASRAPYRRARRLAAAGRPIPSASWCWAIPAAASRARPAGLQRSGDWPFPAARGGRGQAEARSGDPCRRLSLSRKRLPRRQSGLRRLALGRQLDHLAGRFLHPGRAAAGGGAHRVGARQSRGLPPRRPGCLRLHGPSASIRAAPCCRASAALYRRSGRPAPWR